MILVIDTAGEKAALSLRAEKIIVEVEWTAGRSLNAEILKKLEELLAKAGIGLDSLKGIIVSAGPGSFTGLRIGISIANALAYALDIPIVGVKDMSGEKLFEEGSKKLTQAGDRFTISVLPEYGAEPNITKPKER